jgi:AraC-like DNA-binding protein
MKAAELDDGWEFVRQSGGAECLGMVGFSDRAGHGMDLRVTAIPAVTVVISFGEDLFVDRGDDPRVLGGFVAGPNSGTMAVRCARAAGIEVRLPLIGTGGFAAADLTNGPVSLDELWGRRAERLREQLENSQWERRFELVRGALAQQGSPIPPGEVAYAWHTIVASRGRVRVEDLARNCGWSRKRLWRRFEACTGLTPKRAAMLVRFRYAVEGLVAGKPAADVALDSGFTDQPHLCRDVAAFAGVTPGAVSAALAPVAARRYGAWGTFFQD